MSSPLALEITNLQKAFGGLPVTQDVSLAVRPGERRLIIGPNGAGKTTLFNQITGDLRPNAGQIKLFGTDVTRFTPYRRAHHGLSRTYQIITLFNGDTLEHNVVLGLFGLRPSRWHMWRPLSFYHRDIAAEARRTLDRVGLLHLRPTIRCPRSPTAKSAASNWRWRCAQQPRLLLLDEPLAGLSDMERATVKSLIASIPRETAIVMIEHDIGRYCARSRGSSVTLLRPFRGKRSSSTASATP